MVSSIALTVMFFSLRGTSMVFIPNFPRTTYSRPDDATDPAAEDFEGVKIFIVLTFMILDLMEWSLLTFGLYLRNDRTTKYMFLIQ